jgi:hypothetical protein
LKTEKLSIAFRLNRAKIAQKIPFPSYSDYISSISFVYISVLSALVDLCRKFKLYVFKLLDLSPVPLMEYKAFK